MVIHMTKPGTAQNPAWEIHVVKWLSTWIQHAKTKIEIGLFMAFMKVLTFDLAYIMTYNEEEVD